MDEQVQEPQEQQQTQVAEAEQQQEAQSQEPQEQKSAPADWALRRIAEITAKRREAEAEAARWKEQYERAQAMVPADQQQHQPQQNVDQLARAYAESMRAQEREQERLAQIEVAGRKEFGAEFDSAVANLNAAGVGGPEFLRVVAEIPNAEKVVAWLGKHDNLGEAVRIAGMSPVQMGIEMTKLSTKAAKEMTKQISKAPAPIQAIDGGSTGSDSVEPAVGSKEWFAWRNQNARKRR